MREDKDIKDYGTNLFHYNNPVYWFILSNHERFGNVVFVLRNRPYEMAGCTKSVASSILVHLFVVWFVSDFFAIFLKVEGEDIRNEKQG